MLTINHNFLNRNGKTRRSCVTRSSARPIRTSLCRQNPHRTNQPSTQRWSARWRAQLTNQKPRLKPAKTSMQPLLEHVWLVCEICQTVDRIRLESTRKRKDCESRVRIVNPRPNGIPNLSHLEPSYKIKTCIGGWPNGTPNSSQLEPSYKIKTCIGGWPNGTAKSSQLARNHSIF